MVLTIESATCTDQKSLGDRIGDYFRQRKYYRMIIGSIKKQVREKIETTLHREELERIEVIIRSGKKEQQAAPETRTKLPDESIPEKKSKKGKKEKQLQNKDGDYTYYGAAEYLEMGTSTIHKYRKDKKLQGYMKGNKRFFTKEELDKLKRKEKTEEEVSQGVEDAIIARSKSS